jgi:ribosome maturation factor RimP
MKIEPRVSELVEEKIADRPDLFLVDVKMHLDGKLIVLIDGDKGVAIEDCAAISRYVGYMLEENNYIEHAYNLEVSSPGIDTPLKQLRQYRKNIGRIISIKTIDGKTAEGTLIEASEFEVRIKGKEKGRKIEAETVLIPFEQITETRVLISFK